MINNSYSNTFEIQQASCNPLACCNRTREMLYVWGFILFNLILRVIFVFIFTDYTNYLSSDMGGYWNRANELLEGNVSGIDQWVIWPPFYHILISQVFKVLQLLNMFSYRLEVVLGLNIFLGSISLYFLYEIIFIITGRKLISFVMLFIYGFAYPIIYMNAYILSENFAIPIVIISFYFLFKDKYISSAIFLGIVTACRPPYGIFGLSFVMYLLLNNKSIIQKLYKAAIFSILFFIIIIITIAHNYHISGGKLKGLAACGGVDFYLALYQKYSVDCRWNGLYYVIVPPSVVGHPELGSLEVDVPIYDQKYFYHIAWEELSKNPKLWWIKVAMLKELIWGTMFPSANSCKGYPSYFDFWRIIHFVLFIISPLICVCFDERFVKRKELSTILFSLLSFVIICFFYQSEHRYFYSFAFLLYLVSFSVLHVLITSFKSHSKHILYYIILLLLIFAGKQVLLAAEKYTANKTVKITVLRNTEPITNIYNEVKISDANQYYVDTVVFPWSETLSHHLIGKTDYQENFTAIIETEANVLQEGVYEFIVYPDDAFSFYIDDQLLFGRLNWKAFDENKQEVNLTKGLHKIKIHFFQYGGKSGLVSYYRPVKDSNGFDERYELGLSTKNIEFHLPPKNNED